MDQPRYKIAVLGGTGPQGTGLALRLAAAALSIPPPSANRGIWLEFEGARWYSGGPAVPFSADRFTPIGDLCGFPVYRDKAGQPWVSDAYPLGLLDPWSLQTAPRFAYNARGPS